MALNPLGPVAGAYCLDNSEIAAIIGPVGSAKTTASMMRLARHAYEQRPYNGVAHTRFAIVRNTGPQLVDTTMKSWFKLFPTDNKFRKYTSTTRTQTWKFRPEGYDHIINAEFIFRALDDEDDVANLLSLEVTGFYFNEAREINSTIFAHAGRRAGRFPGADMGGCTWRGWIGDSNPWAATADLHDWFVSNKRKGYAYFKQPGGMDPDAENLENLEQTQETLKLAYNDPVRREQGRTYYINALRDYNKNDADMYVHSKYGASRDGKPVYVSYDDNTHCQEFELMTADKVVPILIGYDNTGRNPAAAIAQRTMAGQWRVSHELCAEGMGMKQHAKALRAYLAEQIPNYRIERITCDPAGAAKGADDLDMRMVISMEFPGVPVLNARTNDPATRIEAVDGTFRRMINGEPAMIIHPRCKTLRAACIQKYHYRKMKLAGEERYSETPEKITPYADIADAVQYLCLGGGEGRINSDDPSGKLMWGKGRAITPVRPNSIRFDPTAGSFFNEQ
jgi:hypothetical protein